MIWLLTALLSPPALAGQLAGVNLPDTADVGGKSLVLNGMGLREKYFIDVYVGALYLPARSRSSTSAINDDVPKRIVMHFIYSEVGADKLAGAFNEGLASDPNAGAVRAKFNQLNGMMQTVHAGDEIYLDYVPGTGTTVWVNDAKKGTIAGADFMKSLWRIYLGPTPPTTKLKRGMLGG